MEKGAAIFFLLFAAGMVVLYGIGTEYRDPTATSSPGTISASDTVRLRYPMFTDVHVFIFVGFGFLMSFMRLNSFTATGHTFLVACYAVLWAVLNRGFWERAMAGVKIWDRIQVGTVEFIGADFCAAAVLISFGALLGRVTASQLLMMAIIEVVLFSINEMILKIRWHVVDYGGSMYIFVFGAYFGLACSFVLEKVNAKRNLIPNLARSTRVTDTMAMLGTLFLFCFWPSFNSALAPLSAQDRAVTNTVLSIMTSTCVVYFLTCILDVTGRFGMVEVQNATIAGGVAMGAAGAVLINPFGAMVVGAFAGLISVLGYRYLTPALERIGLRDTCGVHNLHGMPGIVGCVASAIGVGAARIGSYWGTVSDTITDLPAGRTRHQQAGYQMAALGTSLGIALVGGAITGVILAMMPSLPAFFDDVYEYIVPDDHVAEVAAGQKATGTGALLEGGAAGGHTSASTTNAMPMPFTNAPSATEHGATITPAQPIIAAP